MDRSADLPPLEGTICLQCGDPGWENAFVYCVKCLEFAVHRYCLDDIPETMDEFVRWFCDDCKAKMANQLGVNNSKIPNDVSPIKLDSKRKRNATSLTGEEVHGQVNCSFDQSRDTRAVIDSDIPAQPKELNLEKTHNDTTVEDTQRQLRGSFNQPCVEPVGCNTEAQLAGCREPGLPVIDIIWEGCFKICNRDYDIFDGLVAHLSVKASVKVYKEAKSFPPMLNLEMLPKSDVWPKSFHDAEPTDENIALYFFPADTKCERDFDYLVETMMREELAMRAVLTNAELLVFTSQELPLLYWRFQGKYYLWGVFRGTQRSSNSGTAPMSIDNTISHSNAAKICPPEPENAV